MKRFLAVLGVGVALAISAPLAAHASGTIPWTGHGSDNLPCSDGGHWVLAPAFGITSAALTVDGSSYMMTQNGNGSWAADSSGAITASSSASVSYTGPGDHRDHLQLSHCVASESPTPTPTETPSPSPSETGTPSPSGTGTPSPSETGTPSHSHKPSVHYSCCLVGHVPGPHKPAKTTALTGSDPVPYVVALVVLGLVGGTALLRGRGGRDGRTV